MKSLFSVTPVDSILLKLINMMYLDYKGKKQNENPSILSKVIVVLFPNTGNISKYSWCCECHIVNDLIIIVFVGYMAVSWFSRHCQ